MVGWEESYVGRVRRLTGSRALLIPGARAFIRDDDGRTLFIRRRDNGHWAFPAGTMELGETKIAFPDIGGGLLELIQRPNEPGEPPEGRWNHTAYSVDDYDAMESKLEGM